MRLEFYADVAKSEGYQWSDFVALAADNVTETANDFVSTGCSWRDLPDLEDYLDQHSRVADRTFLDAFEQVLEATL